MDHTGRAGIVLAGGHSVRFGDRDKALAAVADDPMLALVVTRLGEVVDDVVVNCREDQREAFERALATTGVPTRFAVDPVPDQGPLAGLRTALQAVETEYVAVVACDMPGLDPSFLDALFDHASERDGAVPTLRGGERQPVQAVYRVDAIRPAAERSLDAGRRSLHSALDKLDVAVVPAEAVSDGHGRRSLRDLNTPADLDDFERDA